MLELVGVAAVVILIIVYRDTIMGWLSSIFGGGDGA